MKSAILLFLPAALCAASARALEPAAPPAHSLTASRPLPGLPYLPAGPAPESVLPPVQEPFAARHAHPVADGATLSAPPSHPRSPLQNPLFRPTDHALFQREHPLLTPDTPVQLNTLADPRPESRGIVELPAP